MLSEVGISKKESSRNVVLRHGDNSRKRSFEATERRLGDDFPKQLAQGTKSFDETEGRGLPALVVPNVPANIPGSWKRNRTARRDGGAKRWENVNSQVLQPSNGKASLNVLSLGSLSWGKCNDGLWWPAQHLTVPKNYHMQSIPVPEDADKFEAAVAEANKVYIKQSGEVIKPPLEKLKGAEMEGRSRKGSRKVSGLHSKPRSKQEITNEELPKDGERRTRKRERENKELKNGKCIDFEEGLLDLPADTLIQLPSKKRKFSSVHCGLNKENAGKRESLHSDSALQEKTRGDDGYFFECVVCDMGGNLLCCDNCPRTYHLECLDPPLKRTPLGKWHCPSCREIMPAVKAPARWVLDSRRSMSIRRAEKTHSTINGQKESPKDQKSETGVIPVMGQKSETGVIPVMASQLPLKRMKILKKKDRKKLHVDGGDTKEVRVVAQVCSQCGADIENGGPSLIDSMLCKQCCKAGSIDTGSSHVKEPEAMATSNIELEKTLMEPSTCMQSEEEKDESRHKVALSSTLEVDRIFGCRVVSIAEPFGASKNESSQEKGIPSQDVLEGQSGSAAEATLLDALPSCENGTEQESSSVSGSKRKIQSSSATENLVNDPEDSGASCMITRKTRLFGRKDDLVNGGTICRTEECSPMESENDVTIHSRKDLSPRVDTRLPENEMEYLVKWVGRSHIHDKWVRESELKILAKRKLDNYKFKHGSFSINLLDEKWCRPQRIIGRRQWQLDVAEVLVKWCGLPYDECTWERLDEPVIQRHQGLLESCDYFENVALKLDEEETVGLDYQPDEIHTLNEQPLYIKGGSLFPHQMEALNWLRKCWGRRKNVILADEMGLGKTISASAFICSLYQEFKIKAPCLVLVPLSTMPNWLAEFSLWTPQLNVVEYHGGAKARAIIRQYEWHAARASSNKKDQRSYKFNVLLTTYEMVIADASQLRPVPWEVLVVDEGHRLKNTESKLVQLLNTFSFSQRVLLTGTPLQNNIGEMHNLLKFLQLQAFPSLASFENKFNCLSTAEQVEELKKLVAPHMLRRLKKDAMQNIPPKMERVVPVELSSLQAEYYRALLTKNFQVLRQAGKPNQHQSLVNIVVQLRKVCNHPYLIPGTEPESGSAEFLHSMRIKASAKLTLLHAMLKILREQGHRVLVFSQMTRLLDILEDYLTIEFGSQAFERVDGSISVAERQAAIARFNQDSSRFVFLLSTRACGLGINLATADTVIIYDSDFNPHADIQAMNRAHRIGQSKQLLVYRLVVRASVEERILQLAKKKLMLDHLFANKSGSQKEVENILRWGTEELFQDCSAPGEGASDMPLVEDVMEGLDEPNSKQRKRSSGLGDVYEDTCHKAGRLKMLWDDSAVARLLDRSEIGTEVTEGEAESDMLGSLKAWDWNEQDTADDQGASECITKEKDAGSPVDANAVSVGGQGTEEDSNWDKILRTRWEKLQIEEEGALGRGKRMRKTISYNENFSIAVTEVSNESGNEDEENAEPEYTPAGRALKNKLARLRARQKERIAARYNKEPGGNFTIIQSSFAGGYSAAREIQVGLFSPVQMSGQDLHLMFSDTGLDASLLALTTKQSTKGNCISTKARASSAVKLPATLAETNTTLYVNQSEQGDHISKEMLGTSNAIPVSNSLRMTPNPLVGGDASSLNHPEFLGSTVGAQTGYCSLNLGAGFSREQDAFSFVSTLQGSTQPLNQLIGEKLPCESAEKSFAPNSSPNLIMSLGLGISLGTGLDLSRALRPMESAEELRQLPSVRSANLSQGAKMVNSSSTFANVCASKPETDLGCGLSMLGGSNIHKKDEEHGRSFPFLPCLGGVGGANQGAEAPAAWTEEELDTLWSGVRRHGRGNWVAMLQDPKLCFLKLRTAKDLAERWNDEQLKVFGGIFDHLDIPISREGSRLLFSSFGAGLQTPPVQRDSLLATGSSKDTINSAELCWTREMLLPKIGVEGLYHRGSKDEMVGLPGLPHMGVEVRNKLTHLGTKSGGCVATLRDDVTRIDLGQKIDLEATQLSKGVIPPDNQGADSSTSHRLLSGLGTFSQKNTRSSPFLFNQSFTDPLTTSTLPRCAVGDGEWRFSNLQLRFEKGPASAQTDPFELPKLQNLPNKMPQSLQDFPYFNGKLNLLASDKLTETRGVGLHQIVRPSNVKAKVDKKKSKASHGGHYLSMNAEEDPSKSTPSSLPHWLREAFKPPARVESLALLPTIASVSHAIDLVYRDCKSTLPAWINPGPPPVSPHRKTKKKRKRKKGVELGCRMMGNAHAGTREHLGNVMLPNLASLGKQNHFSSLSLDSSRFLDSSLVSLEARKSSMLLNGPSCPPFPWTLGESFEWHNTSNTCLTSDMPAHFPGIGNLSLPDSTSTENLQLPSLTSPFFSFDHFGTSDLALNSFPKGKRALKLQDQGAVQQHWPFLESGSNESYHTRPQFKSLQMRPCEPDPTTSEIDFSREKARSQTAESDDSSSKTQSDSCVKISGRGKSNNDDASSEQTVSDSKNNAD